MLDGGGDVVRRFQQPSTIKADIGVSLANRFFVPDTDQGRLGAQSLFGRNVYPVSSESDYLEAVFHLAAIVR